MVFHAVRRRAALAVLAIIAGCGYDSTAPASYDSPPPHEPPAQVPPPQPTLGDGLWVATGVNTAIVRLETPQQLSSGRVAASTIVTPPLGSLHVPAGVAFDEAGTLWIADAKDSVLAGFSSAVLATSGERGASTIIRSLQRSLSEPRSLAFDREHRLWVANHFSGTLVRFERAQLASSGAPGPQVVIAGVGHPAAIAFDADGALWVADDVANTIAEYSAAQLESSGAPAPDAALRATKRSLVKPSALAFDVFGTLWVANAGAASVVGFSQHQLFVAGSPSPSVTLTSGATPLPVGLAFDTEGSLWVVSGGSMVKFGGAQLLESGAPEPLAVVSVDGDHPIFFSAAFWPRPSLLPLN